MEENTQSNRSQSTVPRLKQYKFADNPTINYIKDIQEKYGLQSETETLRMIIRNQHQKEFPEYIQVARARPTPVDKAKAKFEAEEQRQQLKEEKQHQAYVEICNMLDSSTIIDHPITGKPACQYPIFTAVSPHKVDERMVTEELDTLTKETPLLQYRGLLGENGIEGKESVMKILAKQSKLNK